MKKIYSLFLSIILTSTIFSQVPDLNFTGIMDLTVPTGGSDGKAIQFTANQNIADLSIYSVSTFSNGNTSGSSLYALPSISVSVGEHILLCRDSVDLSTYFGSCWSIFDHVFQGSQPSGNGDDAVVLYENGVAIETFGVVGVDGSGESWEYLDSWAWKDTALANVGNWVYGGVNCSDGSADMQSSSCPFPLCTSSQPSTYNVTLSVNTANITVGGNGMYAGGGVLGLANAVALSDPDGDGTWTGVATFPAAGGNYVFLNSPANDQDWGAKEVLTGLSCANGQYDDRLMGALTADTTMLHCFASCETDGTCPTSPPPATIVNVTFKVDMSQVSVSFTTPELNGTFNGWCGNCNSMSDADGDNIWDVTIPLDSGSTVEYKFSADTWSIEEMNDPNASCTNGDTVNTNRILIVPGSDITLTDVCWGSCDPCSTGIIGEALSEINIYPNPASSLLNVNSIETLNRIILRDVTGRVIIDARPTSKHYSIDVSGLSTNMYFIECFDNNRTTVKRVFVTK